MPLDFSKMTAGPAPDTLTEPRKIFAALSEKERKYDYLRDVQGEVLETWHARRQERDLVIKMNTGSGKTVVGLLVLQSSLHEAAGPAVYVTPDPYLTSQVISEADALGVAVVEDPRHPAYLRGEAILVININKLFNGRSVFGVGSEGIKIAIGTVLIDDAHACLAKAEEKFRLTVPQGKVHDELLRLFAGELGRQSPTRLLDLESGSSRSAARVPYWAWQEQQAAVVKRLHSLRETDLQWTWRLVEGCLRECDAIFTGEALEIVPPCLPVETIPAFHQARRRLYLTATLADDSILITDFAADAASIASPITPGTAGDLGDRMILIPQETHPEATEDQVRDLVVDLAATYNVVVIVPSWRVARSWESVAALTLDRESVYEGVERLRAGHVGLVVFVNRYDGIDLPGDACRVLVLDGLPESYTGVDRLAAEALAESDAMMARQLQRIEQGMGRAVRSNDDHCAVILLGGRLTQRIHTPGASGRFSPATRVQLDLSRQIAAQLADQPLSELRAAIDQCLARDRGWVRLSREALANVTYDPPQPADPVAVARRVAFDAALIGQHRAAVDALRSAINATADLRLRGWLKQQAAVYANVNDPVEAQKLQVSAVKDNRALTRPLEGIAYTRLSQAAGAQAASAARFLEAAYPTSNDLLIGINAVLDRLVFDPDQTEAFEAGMEALGRHLGFATQRPEREIGQGPDDLWALGGLKFWVIECKSGASGGAIWKKDAAQLGQAIDWFYEQYDNTCTAVPVLVHPTNRLGEKATAREGTRIVTADKLEDLKTAVRQFAQALAAGQDWTDEDRVAARLQALKLNGAALAQTFTIEPGTAATKRKRARAQP
jgi:hypothetical protein